MPLTRLSAPITTLIPNDQFTLEQLEDSPMFQTLTHLDVTGYCTSLASYYGDLPDFPNLAHVSVPICACASGPVHGLLMKYPKLKVVALLEEMTTGCLPLAGKKPRKRCNDPRDLCLIPTLVPFVSSDPRIVALKCDFLSNWELAAQQGGVEDTLWDKVDSLARQRVQETH
ncbi:hypothetical protein BDN72DRAFT_845126 [Pluteus cervinus]|uniref:Uncharacterized protein n=1 Tax=Pluteus cervinus TaxID=181527 RepID=A0ACD3AJX7_9AGAR|nr:hypothetical protein BDN72DRAFT_845126 [Pluteus cervinus]